MKNRLTLQQRLIFPIALLGLITLLSNILAVFNINNVNSNAGTIVNDYMASEAKLEEIVKMYYKKYPLEEQYKNLEPDVEMLIGRLIELMDDEKQYKKYAKQGYPVMIAYRKNVNGVSYFGAYKTKEFADADIKKENLIVLQRYESLEDFDISQ